MAVEPSSSPSPSLASPSSSNALSSQSQQDHAPVPSPSPSSPTMAASDSQNKSGHVNGESPSSSSPHDASKPGGTASGADNAAGSVEKGPRKSSGKSSRARSSKPSVLSRIFRVLLPCIGPSSAHPVEVDVAPTRSSPEPSPTVKQEKESAPAPVQEEKSKAVEQVTPDLSPQPEPEKKAEEKTAVSEQDENTSQEVEVKTRQEPELLPEAETEGLTSGAVQPPGSTGVPPTPERPSHASDGNESDRTSFTEEEDLDDVHIDDDEEEDKLILNGGAGIPIGPDGIPRPLLPPIAPIHAGRKCLVLDLDETLVHSSFKSISQADYVVPVEIEYHWHNVYVIKRPGVDNFLKKMGEIYEVVVFTASLSKYADPVLDKLDIHQVVSHRLFRESCYNHKGNYVKDLSQLGRPISDTIILDNSPASYIFHPNNAVPVSSWFNDPHDTELTDLVPFLTDLATVDDVRGILDGAR